MASLTPAQQVAETAVLRLLRRHLSQTYLGLREGRALTRSEVETRLRELRALKDQHQGMAGTTTAIVNQFIRELNDLRRVLG